MQDVKLWTGRFAPRCGICEKPIIPKENSKERVKIFAMDSNYHPECFKCEKCGVPFSTTVVTSRIDFGGEPGCFPFNQHLYCKLCNSQNCFIGADSCS
ncbi:unnamed protein product [Strongylus vulgaris]|uniref:LIM zinc-binding domain-containing protein n=1 Tax=Strongylus vulgaris TaxID=40348 RepID=A0A3P7LTT3_STRVU|nr:unnamed protein product [Strongylus vulgaris]